MRRMSREPLVHFLILGVALFLAFGLSRETDQIGDVGVKRANVSARTRCGGRRIEKEGKSRETEFAILAGAQLVQSIGDLSPYDFG